MAVPRFIAKRITTGLPPVESIPGVIITLDAGQRRTEETFNLRALIQENQNKYTDQLPPGPFVLGSNVNLATIGAYMYVYVGAKLFGPDACQLDVYVHGQVEPGTGLQRFYSSPFIADATATVFRTLVPPIVHRYRLRIGYETVSGLPATGLNLRQVSISWRARSGIM